MKSIKHRIIYFTLLPFLAVFFVLSAFIVYQVYKIQISETNQRLKNMALYNEANLKKCYETVELSVQISAAQIENIDPRDPGAREAGERVITSRFRNPYVINAWLAFEPNAFDNMDSLYTNDYPGAPSGRYIRSFIKDGNTFKVLDDIDEATLDDRDESYYYVIPMETGRFFTDFGSHELLWDYGEGQISSFGVSQPVYRDGVPIGCVGLDALINEEMLGARIYVNSVSALFLSDGRLGYSLDTENVGKTLEELGFSDSDYVTDRLQNGASGFHYLGHSGLSGVESFNYFFPVDINGQLIYLYTSLPQKDVLRNTFFVLLPIGGSFFISLVVFIFFFLYLSRGIASPLKKLAEASESMVSGKTDMITSVVNTKDEMGMISKSLVRMSEQFKTAKLLQERYYERFNILYRIHCALFRNETLGKAFQTMLTDISDYFQIHKASLVFITKNSPIIIAEYPGKENEGGESVFVAHHHVKELLEGKKLLSMNGNTLETAQFPFLSFHTKSMCILPLRMDDILRGYIIMEGKEADTIVHDDTTLLFIGDTLSYIIGSRMDWDEKTIPEQPEQMETEPVVSEPAKIQKFLSENDDILLQKASSIKNLDIEKGILLIGGDKKKYAELLRITIKVIAEEIIKMRRYYTEDLGLFAIEVHGIKAALYNIGAEALGDEARQLEFAAKSDDADYCRENYPFLEEKLRVFSRSLAALFPRQKQYSADGKIEELEEALMEAQAACDSFDVSLANSLLEPFAFHKWNNAEIEKSIHGILLDMENLEYDGMSNKISTLLEFIRNMEK